MELQLSGLQALADTATTQPSIGMKLMDMLSQGANVLLSAKQQKDLNKLNLERAKQGLPPIDTAAYAEASAPVMKVQGGVDANTRKMMWAMGLGVLAIGGFGVYMATRSKRK